MESGGYATVWSLRFQHLWAVRQLLLVLAEELRSVRIEPAGVEGEGVDLIVTLPDETLEFQQCKRSFRQTGKWSLNALATAGVLSALGARLRSDPKARFRLVSVDAAPDLRELGEAARTSRDSRSFHRDQIGASQKRTRAFVDFCRAQQLDDHDPQHIAVARDLLRRTFTESVGDDEGALRELRSSARYWVEGDSGAVVASLESFAQANLRCALTAGEVERFLRSRGFELRRLARDPRILPAVRQLQDRFRSSLAPHLVRGELMPRDEATRLVQLLTDPAGPRFIALHGPAGVGKSGLLLDVSQRLESLGMAILPIRLDRQRPAGTTRRFGETLDLPESPALCLHALAAGRPGVLLLDQLDALRWTGGDAAHALEICRELVEECFRHQHLRVVTCCRTFDLENDPQIRGWIEHGKVQRVPVDYLSEELVRKIVESSGIRSRELSPGQLDLLRTLQYLRTWEEIVRVTGSSVQFQTERELLDAFWRSRLREVKKMGIEPPRVQEVVNEIVEFMDQHGTLLAPRRLLQGTPEVEDVLCSLNVLTISQSSISFSHQIYLDHQLAYVLLRRIDEGGPTIKGWLAASHQGLYRREQLRLVLNMLRNERYANYLREIQGLVGAEEVRFHLKQLVLEVLGRLSDPRKEEIDFILSLLENEDWQEHVGADILYGHPNWFEAASEAGIIASWLEGPDEQRERALGLVRSVIEQVGEACSALLIPLTEQGTQAANQVWGALPMAPAKDSPSVFELRVKLAETGIGILYFDWKGLGGERLPRLVRLLPIVLSSLVGQDIARHRESGTLHGISKIDLSANAVAELLAAWDVLIPQATKALNDGIEEVEATLVEHPAWRLELRELLRHFAAELVARDARAMMAHTDQQSNNLADLLILEALAKVEDPILADRAIEWLIFKPTRLRLRWTNSDLPWEIAGGTVAALSRQCSDYACSAFERFLLDHRDDRLKQEMKWRHQQLLDPEVGVRFAQWVLARPSHSGEAAHHLLPAIPADRRSEMGNRRVRELQRKFAGVDEIFFAGWGRVRGGSVGSPLPGDRLNALSDRTWLKIIRNNSLVRPGTRWSRRYRDDRIEESTPEAFSSDLHTATVREPSRFAQLVTRFPTDVNPLYFAAVLRGLRAETRKNQPAADATLSQLEGVLTLPQVSSNPSVAISVARLIGSRADLNWSPSTLVLLSRIATDHADPDPHQLHIRARGREVWGPTNLTNNALNCTRGAATLAVARLLFADPRRTPYFIEAMERIVIDPHPAVRAAAFDCCLAVLECYPDRAIVWALRAAEGHEALLACPWFDRFLRYSVRGHAEELEPVVKRMLASSRDDVVRVAARQAVAMYLIHGRMEEAAVACVRGSLAQRRSAAQVAAALAGRPEYHGQAEEMLLELSKDDSEEVLIECGEVFRGASLELFADSPHFLESFASSRAFLRHPTTFLHRLSEHGGSLMPFAQSILTACRSLSCCEQDVEQKQRTFWESDHYLPAILLRLYEQAPNGSNVREFCLDAWDLLLAKRVVSAVSLTKKLSSE